MIQETGPNHPTSLYIYTDQNSYEPPMVMFILIQAEFPYLHRLKIYRHIENQ
ncbi:hypothetical protein [Snodgrassella communis]|uniref:hypothetical protein n=1 Tax=Snodgrassella communis TaxID=2946699 RepID=UPI001EF71728|nr:hypothetical protein [Snodgrassella communis]